jgi:selenocysteine lyase/cysteine desulfurase
MTAAYTEARKIIKQHVNAGKDDILMLSGSGMTGAKNKLVRLLGLRVPEPLAQFTKIPQRERPIVFISHMEHHSNHTLWLETISEVRIIPHTTNGLVDTKALENELKNLEDRRIIVSITAASNVTGIKTPYYEISGIAHKYGGICLVDFACSAPYVDIDMHPNDSQYLDAITFSPHKFLGGPGSSGVLVMNKNLYKNSVPDNPGGGTVVFTDPWGNHLYKKDPEEREDGGTPPFLQAIRIALSIKLKEKMGTYHMYRREEEINKQVFDALNSIDNLKLLAENNTDRLSIFSFYIEGINYDLVVRLLNDRFGIQARGGCSCAGTYGHYLLNIDKPESEKIMIGSLDGCTIDKPGWVRVSFHPTMTDKEVLFICKAIKETAEKGLSWSEDYLKIGEGYLHMLKEKRERIDVQNWFIS